MSVLDVASLYMRLRMMMISELSESLNEFEAAANATLSEVTTDTIIVTLWVTN